MSGGVLDRVRHRFRGKRRTPANEPPGVGAASPMSAPVQTNDPSQDFLQVALQELSEDEKTTLREHLTSDVDSTIQATYDAAEKLKRACEERRWPGGDTANKVLLWLDRFKSVGDVVANVDPIHVGLPWAGIRMLLGVRFCHASGVS
nr:hypothetical protein CFP56_02706 [Quercus suber]